MALRPSWLVSGAFVILAVGLWFGYAFRGPIEVKQAPTFAPEGSLVSESTFKEGMNLIKKEGGVSGEQHFEKLLEKTGSIESIYGLAWAAYSRKDLGEAERLVTDIIISNPSPRRMVKSKYLHGLILLNQHRYKHSIQACEEALVVARDNLDPPRRRTDEARIHLVLAQAFIERKHILEAEKHLHLVHGKNKDQSIHKGIYYQLQSRVAFYKRNYVGGLGFALAMLDSYENAPEDDAGDLMKKGVAHALSDVAFFLILTGDLAEAENKTNQANELLESIGDSNRLIWNRLNMLMLLKCNGDSRYLSLVTEINAYAEKQGDQELIDFLTFALDWHCD